MLRRWLSLLLCLHVCLGPATNVNAARAQSQTKPAAAPTATKPATVRVDETATRVSLGESRIKVSLAVANATRRPLGASVALELLDTKDSVVARDERFVLLHAGVNSVAAHFPLAASQLRGDERRALLWYRLRYRVTPKADALHDSAAPTPAELAAARGVAEGVVSLSEVTPELFELRVAAPPRAREGQSYRVRARTIHPVSARPVGGARVTAVLGFDDEQRPDLSASATTGADGYATLDFKLPARVSDDEVDLKVTARLGGFEQSASDDFEFDRSIQYLVTTDKPLYQPGQTLHVRALLLDPSRRAVPGVDVDLEIKDEEGTTVFRAPLQTSRFGVASALWPIPEGARLGDYRIRVETDDPRYDGDDTEGLASVRVSRYELPNFSVQVKPERDYYLPGESAAVEVRADYLFGQPVKRGRVRVVRESERRWNFERQRYDVKEGAKYEGEFDAAGRFVARVALADEHRRMAANTWSRFEDAGFAAYVTDPTTNRTEQRRFSLRVTRDPVHIYVTEGNYQQAEGLPLAFYVLTYYPDGTPAECEVKISEHFSAPVASADKAARAGEAARATGDSQALRTVRTNRYGVAKVVGPVLARGETPRRKVSLGFEARDREGRGGRFAEEFWLERDHPAVRVETDKSIYAPGEPVEVEISSDKEDMRLHFDVAVEGRVLRSETVRLRGGRARVSVPYQTDFQNRVTLAAYTTELPEHSWQDYAKATRAVIFPRDRELKFNLRFSRAAYEPGVEASADLSVRTAAGRAVESALGVVVFDKAVEERARTDSEFATPYGFSGSFHSFWYGPEAIGGVSLRELEKLDPRKGRPSGFDTVAELLLQRGYDDYSPNLFGSGDRDAAGQADRFAGLAAAQLKPARDALAAHHAKTGAHPTDVANLRWLLLAVAGIDLDAVRDPWGTPYRAEFTIERQLDVLWFVSAGADKRFGTDDDWRAGRSEWHYFRPVGERMNGLVDAHQRRTRAYLRDAAALKAELRAGGIDFDALRDRWGRPYDLRSEIAGTNFIFRVVSAGPDGRFSPTADFYSSDDFYVWTLWADYFAETRARADTALTAFHKTYNRLPRDESELRQLLRGAGVAAESLRDPWGRDYYAAFSEEAQYADRTVSSARPTGNRTETTPVTQRVAKVTLRSEGADGRRGTPDDFQVAEFAAVTSQQSARDKEPLVVAPVTTFSGATGAITGTVLDPQGASIAGATVKATHYRTGQIFEAMTDDEGRYTLRNLPSGSYDLNVESPGFKVAVVAGVEVRAASLAQVDLTLNVGAISETVTITGGGGERVDTTSTQVSSLKRAGGVSSPRPPPVTTPRLRKDFPETLYWQPELLTDKSGRTRLKFKLADNITTWKVSVIGSTETGELGTVEREIRAFQPFFVEHDPPRVLTEGDEISLPVTLRNYLDRAQRVALDLKPEAWFTLLGPATQTSEVAAGDAARATFELRATASVKEGKQRITAVGPDASDAIEKPVHVHPDGEEIAETATGMFDARSALEVDVPATAIPRSARAELKVYPNLISHAVESIEAVMSRPYGCGEQTISSSYPSLLVLRHYARLRGTNDDARLPSVAVKARRYVQLGRERLLSYRNSDGGFAYWGGGASDLALTAYAVRFLRDASEFVEVDDGVLDGARAWLAAQQRPDGSWPAPAWDNKPDVRRTALLTAYVARVLAERDPAAPPTQEEAHDSTAKPGDKTEPGDTTKPGDTAKPGGAAKPGDTRAALARALKYLAARSREIDEPYLIAAYLLAAIDGAGAPAEIERAAASLRSLAREEAGGTYWALETNTPFYGWGLAGRIETTALAVQALSSYCGLRMADCGLEDKISAASQSPTPGSENPQSAIRNPQSGESATRDPKSGESATRDPQLISRGLLFLLRNKDRYGVWLSTQATVNVLDALVLLSRKGDARGARTAAGAGQTSPGTVGEESAQVFVNGQPAGSLALPSDERADAPVSLDLSRFLAAGANRVELRRAGGRPVAAAQLVTTYYVPWPQSNADGRNSSPRSSRALRLAVAYERTRADVGDEIVCRVEAERIGHGGYGMLLAEVGLPPGVEVNRESLQRAMSESGWEFSRYDVLPDRLVVYLWPRAGGTRFSFTFRPRLGLKAKTAPSQVYDYYNPEARAVVAPASFVVNDNSKARPAQAKKE